MEIRSATRPNPPRARQAGRSASPSPTARTHTAPPPVRRSAESAGSSEAPWRRLVLRSRFMNSGSHPGRSCTSPAPHPQRPSTAPHCFSAPPPLRPSCRLQTQTTCVWAADPVCSPMTATLHPTHPSTQWFQPPRIPRIHITTRETARNRPTPRRCPGDLLVMLAKMLGQKKTILLQFPFGGMVD